MKSSITGQVKTTIKARISEVWEALTNPEIMKQYFFGTDAITDWKIGNPITFSGEWEGKPYEDKGTILAFEVNNLIKYSYWSSMSVMEDKPENYFIITYELTGEDGDVVLTITQENIPDEKLRDHAEENWKMILSGLKKIVEKKSVSSL